MPQRVEHPKIGIRVRELRERNGWSLTQLAQHSGISRSYLFQIEQGDSTPTQDKIQKLAEALGTLASELMGESPKDLSIPQSLREFADQAKLGSAEIQMLAQIEYRGQRPSTSEEWRILYSVIKSVIEKQ